MQLDPEDRRLAWEHIKSFNHFTTTILRKIVLSSNEARSKKYPGTYIRYTDAYLGMPSEVVRDVNKSIYSQECMVNKSINPQECRLRNVTYAADILVNIEYSSGNNSPVMLKNNVKIGRLPIMLKSLLCVLNGKNDQELTNLGECPLDPGGYFVVKGSEKVIIIQEQPATNRIIVDSDDDGRIQASVLSSTDTMTKSKTTVRMEDRSIYLVSDAFTSKIPIMVILKAMDLNGKEVMKMLGEEDLFMPSFLECLSIDVNTRQQALSFLKKKLRKQSGRLNLDGVSRVIGETFIPHIPVLEDDFSLKRAYVVWMLRLLMDGIKTEEVELTLIDDKMEATGARMEYNKDLMILNEDAMDDKDYLGNKQLLLSGQLLALLFEELFKFMNESLISYVDKLEHLPRRFDLPTHIEEGIITHGFERSLSTGNWDIGKKKIHLKGVTENVSRLSFIGAIASMTKISAPRDNSSRALHTSQWGMYCPCDTAVGEACGLVKHLAQNVIVTIEEDEGPIISLCHAFGVENLDQFVGEELRSLTSFMIMINGRILGKHKRPQLLANNLRELRRGGELHPYTSIHVNEKHRCVYIASKGGRVCRPLIIAGINGESQRLKQEEKEKDCVYIDRCLQKGVVEYLDVDEQNDALIALTESEATSQTTHFEFKKSSIYGASFGLIPFAHHNPAMRNTYQCALGKKAMGNIAYNQQRRVDTVNYLLVYPQRPLLTTKTIELIGYDKLGAGENAIVAVMSYGGYDLHDAIVLNKSSLDRGFSRCIVMKKLSAHYKRHSQFVYERMVSDNPGNIQTLDSDGIASPGEFIRHKDIYFRKESPKVVNWEEIDPDTPIQYTTTQLSCKGIEGESAVVDRVALWSDNNQNLILKVMVRHTCRPEVGDRFSSRHGQKGVCGSIVQQEDLPFSETGICPDLIINPHMFQRMTFGMMLELVGSKAGALSEKFLYGDPFGECATTIENISETLVNHGFCYSGKDVMYSGITGEQLQAYIFMGPLYYQKLKHMVMDKMHARSRDGSITHNRQPVDGVRMGAMEKDCLIAHGTSNVLYERLMLSGDAFEAMVCERCGLLAQRRHLSKTMYCSRCETGDEVSAVKMPFATKQLFQELISMNIVPRLKLTEAGSSSS